MFEGDADRPAARHVRPGVEPADGVDDDVTTDADHAADHVRDLDRQRRLGLLDTTQSYLIIMMKQKGRTPPGFLFLKSQMDHRLLAIITYFCVVRDTVED